MTCKGSKAYFKFWTQGPTQEANIGALIITYTILVVMGPQNPILNSKAPTVVLASSLAAESLQPAKPDPVEILCLTVPEH